MAPAINRRRRAMEVRLDLTEYEKLCAEFSGWRIDPFVRMMEKDRREGRVLAFVRGLRLSAQLIYAARQAVSSAGLEADWGHLLDVSGNYCSPECDVIIHKPGSFARWNGTQNAVMDFKFIKCSEALAVISCKSFTAAVDRQYCQKLRQYVNRVWLFAECCRPDAVDKLRKKAKQAGYRGFWYLYTWDGRNPISPNQQSWLDFLKALRSLASGTSEGGARR